MVHVIVLHIAGAHLQFLFTEVAVVLFRKTEAGEIPLKDFQVLSVEAEMTQLTYSLNVKMRLGGLSLHQDYEGQNITVMNTPLAEGKEDYLFVVSYCMVGNIC